MLLSKAMRLVTAAMWLMGALPIHAAGPPLPTLRIERTAAGPVAWIHNPGSQPLTAVLLATDNHPGGDLLFWQDEIRVPIPPGADRQLKVADLPPGISPDRIQLQGALYADGSSAGNPQMMGQAMGPLQRRRALLLETARELLRRVQKAQKAFTPKADLIGDLKVWADSLGQGPDAEPGARALVASTIDQLDGKSCSDVLVDLLKTESDIAAGGGSNPPRNQLVSHQ